MHLNLYTLSRTENLKKLEVSQMLQLGQERDLGSCVLKDHIKCYITLYKCNKKNNVEYIPPTIPSPFDLW